MVKPVWNNAQRVNPQNCAKKTHLCAKKNLVPRSVLMKSGLVSINTARQNISETTVLVNTARQVNVAHSEKQTGNPQMDLQDQGVIDSGCSRHMTGNMSYLTDYKEIDGGYVAFGGNPKGGKITGKEAVNTACYVQNRVLVVKPHNKTPYELFHGRTPTLSFMRPFGCPVTILNTIDHLGKFDGKADEGFFVRYSLNSKAFRVFNSRTRIVEENLHIRFSESIQSNDFAGTKTANPPYSQDLKSSHNDGSKPSSDYRKNVDEDPRKESECDDQEKEDNVNNPNNVNAADTNEVKAISGKTSIELLFDLNMPTLEVIAYLTSQEMIKMMYNKQESCQSILDGNIGGKNPKKLIHALRIQLDRRLARRALQFKLLGSLDFSGFYLMENKGYRFQRGKIDKTLFIKRYKGDILLVQQKKDGIFISQDKYVDEILKKFGFTKVKTASTPMETQKPLLKDEDGKEVDVHMYRSMIGSLMYLTSSRPDIMFAVCACARYQVNLKVSHLHAVKRIFRYLKGQPKLGLWYPKDSPFDLVAYTDSDYAGASLDKKSTIGGCQFLGCRLISWQCKKQTVVANSTTEAKYVAASSCYGQFWSTVKAKNINGEEQLHALVDGKKIIITESSVRRDLQLADEEGVDCLPNSTIFEQLTLMGDPIENVADEAVHKELGDCLVRAATTASNLEAERDSGNINKTQSKATPNESSFQGTYSGGGPCLKKRIKKLEKKNRSRTHRLKRLYKVSLTARVESSDNKESLGEDASKQGRIDAIDTDEEITLVSVHDVNVSAGEEVFATTYCMFTLGSSTKEMKSSKPKTKGCYNKSGLNEETALNLQAEFDEEERLARENAQKEEEANIALIETWDDIQAKIDADHQLAERMQAQEQEELSIEKKATLFQQLLEKRRKHFAAKRAEEKRSKPQIKAQQRKIITELVEGKEKRAGTELVQEITKKQKVEDDKETTELKQLMKILPDEDEVQIDQITFGVAVKSP
ncbi:hypothetical protein Tco_1428692 [Tanacetum coccineum]